jgi:transposase
MDQKKEFVLESLKQNVNFTKLCAKYCISTKTGYKWKERFLARGFEGLNDLSKRPKTFPHKLTEETILEIIRIRNNKKHWGSRKIRVIYSNLHPGETVPSCRTIDRILRKAGLIKPKRRKQKTSGVRIENRVSSTHPNHLWTVDFKGWWYTTSKEKVNPLHSKR